MRETKTTNAPHAPREGTGWCIHKVKDKDKPITNFRVDVLSKMDVFDDTSGKPTTYAKLQMVFEKDRFSDEFTVPRSQLSKIDWSEIDERCEIDPNTSLATAQRIIASHIRRNLTNVDTEELYRLNCVGVHNVKGEAVFCTGKEVIRPPHASGNRPTNIEPDDAPQTLDYDPDLSEAEAAAGLFELMSLFPNLARILVAYNIVFLMRKLYAYAWTSPMFSIFVKGGSGSGKTTLSPFLCQLYNRSSGIEKPPRFNSSSASIVDTLLSLSDCVLVFDDLCTTTSREDKRKQEAILKQIVRIIGDNIIPGHFRSMKGSSQGKRHPEAGVALTREYRIEGSESDIARFLEVEVAKPNHETLQRLSDFITEQPLVVSTAYRNFILWLIQNYDWAKGFLRDWWNAYSKSEFVAFSGLELHGCLRETHYYLNTGYMMFLEYCVDKAFISQDVSQAMQQSFQKLVSNLVLEQQVRVNQAKQTRKAEVKFDALAHIRRLYQNKKLILAPSNKDFNEVEHDGAEHNGLLYLYGDHFRKIITAANANVDDALDDLEARGALVCGREKKVQTKQLPIGNN